jgi:hypothetical protein
VLHSATELAGIAKAGPMPPYTTGLSPEQEQLLAPAARNLFESDEL